MGTRHLIKLPPDVVRDLAQRRKSEAEKIMAFLGVRNATQLRAKIGAVLIQKGLSQSLMSKTAWAELFRRRPSKWGLAPPVIDALRELLGENIDRVSLSVLSSEHVKRLQLDIASWPERMSSLTLESDAVRERWTQLEKEGDIELGQHPIFGGSLVVYAPGGSLVVSAPRYQLFSRTPLRDCELVFEGFPGTGSRSLVQIELREGEKRVHFVATFVATGDVSVVRN